MDTPVSAVVQPIKLQHPSAVDLGAQTMDDVLPLLGQAGAPIPLLIKRGVFHAHIRLNEVLAGHERAYVLITLKPVGKHFTLRHWAPFAFAADLQRMFGFTVIVHVLDVKALLVDSSRKWSDVEKLTDETVRDVLALLNPERTVVVRNSACQKMNYVMMCDFQRSVPSSWFGDVAEDASLGAIDVEFQAAAFAVPAYVAPLLGGVGSRCIMILRESQKRRFELAERLGAQAAVIFGGYVPSLSGLRRMPALAKVALVESGKVGRTGISAREYESLYLGCTPKEISSKVGSAFSGGQDTASLQKDLGARLEVDIPAFFLGLLMDEGYEELLRLYGAGALQEGEERVMTGRIKQLASEALVSLSKAHASRKAAIPDAQVAGTRVLVLPK